MAVSAWKFVRYIPSLLFLNGIDFMTIGLLGKTILIVTILCSIPSSTVGVVSENITTSTGVMAILTYKTWLVTVNLVSISLTYGTLGSFQIFLGRLTSNKFSCYVLVTVISNLTVLSNQHSDYSLTVNVNFLPKGALNGNCSSKAKHNGFLMGYVIYRSISLFRPNLKPLLSLYWLWWWSNTISNNKVITFIVILNRR